MTGLAWASPIPCSDVWVRWTESKASDIDTCRGVCGWLLETCSHREVPLGTCVRSHESASSRTLMERLGFLKVRTQVNQASDLLTLPSCNQAGFQLAVAGVILTAALSGEACWMLAWHCSWLYTSSFLNVRLTPNKQSNSRRWCSWRG